MSLHSHIQQLIQQRGTSESEFCRQFGVRTIEELPLLRLEEIAQALRVSSVQLIYGKGIRKPFPKDIQFLILDVDGVMTDGGMYFSETGDQLKKYNTKDGMAILHLTRNDFQVGILSSGFKGEMVKRRAEMLNIQHFYLGRDRKLDILKSWCEQLSISLKQVAIIGDDINDIEIMQQVGYSACPSDAVPKILELADCILSKKGGEACVREFVEEVMGVEVSFS